MATDLKVKYPASNADSAAVTISLASVATSSTLLAGREATAVVNTTDLDIDKPVTGLITVGTTGMTAGTFIEVWATMPLKIASGAATWPDTITGSDANVTLTSNGVKFGFMRLIASINVDSTTNNRGYPFVGLSLAEAFNGVVPPQVTFFVTQNTGASLNSTAGNHYIHLHRQQFTAV